MRNHSFQCAHDRMFRMRPHWLLYPVFIWTWCFFPQGPSACARANPSAGAKCLFTLMTTPVLAEWWKNCSVCRFWTCNVFSDLLCAAFTVCFLRFETKATVALDCLTWNVAFLKLLPISCYVRLRSALLRQNRDVEVEDGMASVMDSAYSPTSLMSLVFMWHKKHQKHRSRPCMTIVIVVTSTIGSCFLHVYMFIYFLVNRIPQKFTEAFEFSGEVGSID